MNIKIKNLTIEPDDEVITRLKEVFTNSEHLANWKKWLAMLRSGTFRQTTNYLRTGDVIGIDDKYCCLGIACLIGEENKLGYFNQTNTFTDTIALGTYPFEATSSTMIPHHMSKSLFGIHLGNIGFTLLNSAGDEINSEVGFAALNDEHDFTFEDIAALAEWLVTTCEPKTV